MQIMRKCKLFIFVFQTGNYEFLSNLDTDLGNIVKIKKKMFSYVHQTNNKTNFFQIKLNPIDLITC